MTAKTKPVVMLLMTGQTLAPLQGTHVGRRCLGGGAKKERDNMSWWMSA